MNFKIKTGLISVGIKLFNLLKRISLKWKLIVTVTIVVICLTGGYGYEIYRKIFQPNVKKTGMLYIPTGSQFKEVVELLKKGEFVTNFTSFEWVAEKKNYTNRIKPGAYRIKAGWNNSQLTNLLRSGDQEPVKLTFNNIRLREELAGRLSHYLESDSSAFLTAFNNEKLIAGLGFTNASFPMLFIPNTYSFFWNTSPQQFMERMKHEYDNFWNEARKKKAEMLGLTPLQVVTIASIVQEETNKNDEKKRMAGVYINRLKRGWLLQADPTVKFALKDFSLRRILTEYLTVDSPYNTYKYAGLPPGPINFTESTNIDAVLDAENHNFMYFCAKEDFSGFHNFAQSLPEHLRNASKYQNALNKSKIWK